MTVIGLISGTSYDAVDAAAARMRLEGHTLFLVPLGLHSVPIPAPLRARIAAALPPHGTTVDEICRLDTTIGQLFGSVAADANAALTGGAADLVSSHGQTVYHWVDGRMALGTLQLGEPAWIAEASGLPVVSGLRSRDITRGGQGAPLASLLDALLVLGEDRAIGSLNLGGIANITVRSGTGGIVAYDIGPASALIDRAVADATGGRERMDLDGVRAARGRVDADLLAVLLTEPYYRLLPPKSTGKELFHAGYMRALVGERDVPLDDLLATLTELTAILVARSCREYGVQRLFVAGGGVRNPALMGRIRALTARPRARVRRPWDASPGQGGLHHGRHRIPHRARPARHDPIGHRRGKQLHPRFADPRRRTLAPPGARPLVPVPYHHRGSVALPSVPETH